MSDGRSSDVKVIALAVCFVALAAMIAIMFVASYSCPHSTETTTRTVYGAPVPEKPEPKQMTHL